MSVEKRGAPRFELRVPVGFVGPDVEGRGSTANLSGSGARLAGVTASVANGARIQLVFGLEDASLALRAEMVRQTGGGFAARFLDSSFPDSVLRALEKLQSSDGQD